MDTKIGLGNCKTLKSNAGCCSPEDQDVWQTKSTLNSQLPPPSPRVRTIAHLIYASPHASYIVECCHVDACCSMVVVNSYKQPSPSHHVQRCKSNQPWPCACLYAHDQTRPSSFLLQICQVQCLCTTCRHAYKVKLFKNNWIASTTTTT